MSRHKLVSEVWPDSGPEEFEDEFPEYQVPHDELQLIQLGYIEDRWGILHDCSSDSDATAIAVSESSSSSSSTSSPSRTSPIPDSCPDSDGQENKVPGFPQWYNLKYDSAEEIYTYKLLEDYQKQDLEIIL